MKTKNLRLITILLLLLPVCMILLGAGCEKEEKPDETKTNGLVLYYGDPAVDGCGWIIKINNVEYSPINLEPKFQKDSLNVILNYDTLASTWNCGWRKPGYKEIEINQIRIND